MDLIKERKEAIIIAAQASGQPICVHGPPGCGKSRLINLAWTSQNPTLSIADHGPVSLNVDDSIDAKSLVGSYRSSLTEPGRFEWVDGLLVELMKAGRWLVLEDVERVSPDILSILPRMGDEYFSVPERGERVAINRGFGLMGTSTAPNVSRITRAVPSWLLLASDYPEDLNSILNASLPPMVSDLLVKAYLSVKSSTSVNFSDRKIGLHDLFRVAARVRGNLDALRLSERTTFITDFQKSEIGRDLINVFSDHCPFPERREELTNLCIRNSLECGPLDKDPCPAFTSSEDSISIGSTTLKRKSKITSDLIMMSLNSSSFTLTSVHLQIMQRIARSVVAGESVLVVGDTGVGKTSTVQFLAKQLGVKMHVYNFSDQTEGSDLVGGLKPVVQVSCSLLVSRFAHLVRSTLPESAMKSALSIVEYVEKKFQVNDFQSMKKGMEKTALKALSSSNLLLQNDKTHLAEWTALLDACRSSDARQTFQYIEGPLVKAVREGDWILLDEINMAPGDVLRVLNGLVERRTIVIPETGEVVTAHSDFRLFAAMNPPHLGKGKRSLVDSLRSRFLEIYCEEVREKSDLMKVVTETMQSDLTPNILSIVVGKIVDLYLELKTGSCSSQLSGLESGQVPVISLRSLVRALQFAKRLLRSPKRDRGAHAGDGTREIVDGLVVSFTSGLDARSEAVVVRLIGKYFVVSPAQFSARAGEERDKQEWCQVEGQWIACGDENISSGSHEEDFIMTKSVEKNLRKLAVCLAGGKVARAPILLEGSTGAGKTSLVTFLAKKSRHKLMRINNHEHTDLQDYFGQYVSSLHGALEFQEGPLVQAVRQGHWVLLDELNLAPSEILEALNRLLDDNRELVIPETNEVVKAHPDFVLFGTQNPVSMEYAGRKSLSRAFRNRFIDVQIDQLPSEELNVILSRKCSIAPSTATRMLATFTELSRLRRLEGVLSGRDSALVTVRDLLRWAARGPTTREEIALEGYLVLGERLRNLEQRKLVVDVLESKIGVKDLFLLVEKFYLEKSEKIFSSRSTNLVTTRALRRTVALTARAAEAGEPVLLVGETGTGKTSCVQLLAENLKTLKIVNCHQHLESADLIGAVCPTTDGGLAWKDGPLVDACRAGSWVLLDEVNLASDSVVERFNSLLDSDFRAITLAEKPGEETVLAEKEFRFFATMNPGNDFGKKELSAALRNRFCEIYVDPIGFEEDGVGFEMVACRLDGNLEIAGKICECMHFALSETPSLNLSARDALLWCDFIKNYSGSPLEALAHGAALLLLDSLDPASTEHRKITSFLLSSGTVTDESVITPSWVEKAFASSSPLLFGPFILPETTTGRMRNFSLNAPTSLFNFGRLLRAMFGSNVRRPVLLHGDPGAGKSSVVAALAEYCGRNLVRINFSDQTELADILGQNVPSGTASATFVWKDGILLEAIARGDWVLLDELNLAPQAVLEGLNALLDHRAEIYVPAIDRLVKCPESFRLFATQNEARKGDGRKMLPRSLLSRFNRLRVACLGLEDLRVAAVDTMRGEASVVDRVVSVMSRISTDFNLRDMSKLFKCLSVFGQDKLPQLIVLILLSRIPSDNDKARAVSIVEQEFGIAPCLKWIDPALFLKSNSKLCPDLLTSQAMAATAVAAALAGGNHLVVSGASGVGKRSIVKLASEFFVEIKMHSQMDTSDLIGQFTQRSAKSFEWVDSPLTLAVRSGGVVCLSNAHTCPPAILDRLNALIEDRNGVLVIPEKGEAEVIHPHADFRLILCTDKPALLSQAIRNRCVEVALSGGIPLSIFDKVRIGGEKNSLAIARGVATAREMKQAVGLHAKGGLDLDTTLSLFRGPYGVSDQITDIIAETCIERGGDFTRRQFAMLNNSVLDKKSVISWILNSALSLADLFDRLGKLSLLNSAAVNKSETSEILFKDPLAKRLWIQLLISSFSVMGNFTGTAMLHAMSRNFLLPVVKDSAIVCYDTLLSEYNPRVIENPELVFSGVYRKSSHTLFEKILRLKDLIMRKGGDCATVMVELAAAAIALRGSPDISHESTEVKIQSAVEDLIEKYDDKENDEDDEEMEALQKHVESAIRSLSRLVDVETLLKCRVKISEHDLVHFGLKTAGNKNESEFALLANRIDQPSGGIVYHVEQALQSAKKGISCRNLPLTCGQFSLIAQNLEIFPGKEFFAGNFKKMMEKIIPTLQLPSFDIHQLKSEAVTDISLELSQVEQECEVANLCRDVASCGSDDSAGREWINKLTFTKNELLESGIFQRPSSSRETYDKLRYLCSEVKVSLERKTCSSSILKSFLKVIFGSEFALYRDITREIGLQILRLIEAFREQEEAKILGKAGQQIVVPVRISALPDLPRLINWINVERSVSGQLSVPVERFANIVLRDAISARVTLLDEIREAEEKEDEEDSVKEKKSSPPTLASLVENNDKARADAAVASLRKELFPDTSRSFLRDLNLDSFSFEDETDGGVVDVVSLNKGGDGGVDWDQVAMLLVAEEEIVLTKYLSKIGDAEDFCADIPELMALQRLRLESTVATLTSLSSSPSLLPQENNIEETLIENREMKLKLKDFVGGVANFYTSGGGLEALALLSPVFLQVQLLVVSLGKVMEIADHPDVENLARIVEKSLALTAECSAICALQAGEAVLASLEKLTLSIPSRYLGSAGGRNSELTGSLTGVIARLRASEVASWKDLRVIRETNFAKAACGQWFLHLWRLCTDNANTGAEGFDTMLSWLRNSGIGQFRFRVALLEIVAKLTENRIAMHAVNLARFSWESSVEAKLKLARGELNTQVKALIKEIQFRLGGRHYSGEKFRMDTKRSHNQLAAALKRFEECIAERVENVVVASPLQKNPGTDSLSELIGSTVEAIRSAPADKSSKALKQRLLNDVTGEVKSFIKSCSEGGVELKEFSPKIVVENLLTENTNNSSMLSQAMRICNLSPVCLNQDVKPVTIAEWRSLSAHSLTLLRNSCERREAAEKAKVRLQYCSAVPVGRTLIVKALRFLDEAKLIVLQFNALVPDQSMVLEDAVPEWLVDQVARMDEIIYVVSEEYIRVELPGEIRRVCQHVYQNEQVRDLFTKSRSLFDKSVLEGMDLARGLSQIAACILPDEEEVGETEELIEKSTVESILSFTIFLHEFGLCSKEPETSSSAEEGGATDWSHGTGLGDGSGVNDKSEEIEDAGQFDTSPEQQQDKDEEGRDDEEDEEDLNKGVSANADQGMQEEDVRETEKGEEEEDEEIEREMGQVELGKDKDGEIDESGAPGEEDDEDEDGDEKDKQEEEIEVNGLGDKEEDEMRANDDGKKKKEKSEKGRDEEESEGGDDMEDEKEGEGDEKIEAFIDPKNQDDAQDEESAPPEDDSGEDMMMSDDEGGDDDENVEDEQREDEMDDSAEKDVEENNNSDESGEKLEEPFSRDEVEEPAAVESSSSSPSVEQQESASNSAQGSGEGGSQAQEESGYSQNLNGSDFSSAPLQKEKKSKKKQPRSSPAPLNNNSGEKSDAAMDQWLREIKEIIESELQGDGNDEGLPEGQAGQRDEESDKTAQHNATESHRQEEKVLEETAAQGEMGDDKEEECGVNRDSEDVVMAEEDVDELLDDEKMRDEADDSEEAMNQEEKEVEKKKRANKKKNMQSQDVDVRNIPEQHEVPVDQLQQEKEGSSALEETLLTPIDVSPQLMEEKANRLATDLCEKLASVLEPTKRGRLEGYFKTGKRISMRKVLAWIASDYRKDKLWLRRSRPSHRDYRVVICLDNTASMRNNNVGELSLVCVSAISQALALLEVGKVGIMSFGTFVREISPLVEDSCSSSYPQLATTFRFNEESSHSFSEAFPAVVHKCAEAFESSPSSDADTASSSGLALIITDGRFDKDKCRPYVQQLISQGHVPVLIVIDANKEESILSVTSVHFEEDADAGGNKKRKIVRTPFLSQVDCPFPFYAVIQDPNQLPSTLADILRQWIEKSSWIA